VASEGRELAGVRRRCTGVKRLDWPVQCAWRGELKGQAVGLAADGSGGMAAAGVVRAACEHEKVEAVVSTGWCGALAPELARNEIFVAAGVATETGGKVLACEQPRTSREFRTGVLVTVGRVIGTAAEKARLREMGAAADMEAAAVAEEAVRRGLRFYCVRVVLDEAGENFGLDFEAARGENGRLSKGKVLRAALARPARGVPEVARWAWRSQRAARVLGEFLAECGFDA